MRAFVDQLLQDLKYTFRQLARSPGFTAVAIGSLAVGIGANVTVYSAAHALLRQKPVAANPDELVRVYRGDHSPLPRDWFIHVARNSRTMTAVIAEDPLAVGIEVAGVTERRRASIVSENFFSDLGISPAVGSVFAGPAGTPVGQVVVLSHDYWTAQLGADPGAVGKTIRLNNQAFTIAGVARAGFKSSQMGWAPQMFVPMSELGRLTGRPDSTVNSSFYITGRLATGSSPAQAHAELLSLAPSLPRVRPQDIAEITQPTAFKVEQALGVTAEERQTVTAISAFLMVVVGIVLLIACANIANLLLARASGRRREVAIRTALGVSRRRLIRQLLTESITLSMIGGAAGLALAWYGARVITGIVPGEAEMAFNISPDTNVVVFAVLLAVTTGVIFGLAPALHATRTDVQTMLRTDSAGAGARRSRLRSAFLVGQVALATVLLVTSALFVQALSAAQRIDPGFRTDRVADLTIDLSIRQYPAERSRLLLDDVLRTVRALPSVEAATLIGTPPLTMSNSGTVVTLPDADTTDRRSFRGTTFTQVTPGYFEMFGIPVTRGRGFTEADRDGAPLVGIVNESFARMMWPNGDAVGKQVRVPPNLVTIVGVTPDTKYKSLNDQNEPFIYFPLAQQFTENVVLQARLAAGSSAERAALRAAVQALDPALALGPATTMEFDMRYALLPAQIAATLIGGFGLLALFLAAIGVYGVTAYLVGQRTNEIGIRSALGATASNVLGLMMKHTVTLVGIGLVLGLAGGIGIGAVASSQLFGVGALDPTALGTAAGVLLAVGVTATWLPARRALRVDPIRALKSE